MVKKHTIYRIAIIVSPGTAAPNIMMDYAAALKKLGHNVLVLDLRIFFNLKTNGEKITFLYDTRKKVVAFSPHFAMGYNIDTFIYMPDKDETNHLFQGLKIPYISLFYDNPMNPALKNLISTMNSDLYTVFIWDHYCIERFADKYGKKAHYLPLATNPEIFLPRQADSSYQSDLCFIGSVTSETDYDSKRKSSGWDQWFIDFAREVVNTRRINPGAPVDAIITALIDTLPQPSQNEIRDYSIKAEFAAFTDSINAELVDMERREAIKAVPETVKVALYGTQGWMQLKGDNLHFRGSVKYHQEAPIIYNSSKINLNITSAQLVDAVNQRVFDVPACEGFLLTDSKGSLPELFEPDKEVVIYENLADMKEKILYYLSHETERKSIARMARKRLLAQHTYAHRANQIISVLRENGTLSSIY